MADDADRADERLQNILDGGIAIAREKAAKVRALVPCGKCYNCGTDLRRGMVFCAGPECQNDYHYRLRREQELGL